MGSRNVGSARTEYFKGSKCFRVDSRMGFSSQEDSGEEAKNFFGEGELGPPLRYPTQMLLHRHACEPVSQMHWVRPSVEI